MSKDVDRNALRRFYRRVSRRLRGSLRTRLALAVLTTVTVGMMLWVVPRLREAAPAGVSDPSSFAGSLASIYGELRPTVGLPTAGPSIALVRAQGPPYASFAGGEGLVIEAEIDGRVREAPTAENLHARGLVYLFSGRPDAAVRDLASARLEDPADASIASDLALAYLQRNAASGDPVDTLLAAEAAYQAHALDPVAPPALFNLAEATQRIPLVRRAQQAWQDYLELDASSPWADAARDRLLDLDQPTEAARFVAILKEIESRGPADYRPALVGEIARLPGRALDSVHEVFLPRWARAVLDGDLQSADHALAPVRLMASALEASGDTEVGEIVAAIEANAVSRESSVFTASLAQAVLSLQEGVAHRKAGRCGDAIPPLDRAIQSLAESDNPVAHRARYVRAVCLYSTGRTAEAAAEVHQLHAGIVDRSYLNLRGTVAWMLGLSATAAGDYAVALPWYESAARSFSATTNRTGLAGIHTLMAEAYQELGLPERAWQANLTALSAAAATGDDKAIVRALEECVRVLLEEDRLELSVLFQDELLARAGEWEDSVTAVPAALVKRAALLHRLETDDAARSDLERAEQLAQAIPEVGTRERILAEIETVRAEMLAHEAPTDAVARLSSALARYEDSGHPNRRPVLLEARARAHLAAGATEPAHADLRRAIDLVETRRGRASSSEEMSISFFETFQSVYDRMVRFQVEVRQDPRAAFVYADRARSRALLDRLGAASTGAAATPPGRHSDLVEALQRQLLPDVVVIEYGVENDRLYAWTITRDRFDLTRVVTAPGELPRWIEAFRGSLEHRDDPHQIERHAARLFDALVRPVLHHLVGSRTLVLIPDRSLYRLPFAALFDVEAQRYLIESHEVVVAPSASYLLQAADRVSGSGLRKEGALVVANPAFERARYPLLAKLPYAEAEGRAVAEHYPSSTLLTGSSANRQSILEAIPKYRTLHLATHVVHDETRPGRSHLPVAPRAPSEAGAVTVSDLRDAGLGDLDLAFLSACTTASVFPGAEREGVAGLARELLAAGVPAVVASLWKVDDRAAADLAAGFHGRIADGVTPAEALRDNQLESLKHPDLEVRSPASWAAFQVFGGVRRGQ